MSVLPFKAKTTRPAPAPAKPLTIAERVNAVPEGFDIAFDTITRYIEDEAANGGNHDKISYPASTELALRPICHQFGFDRQPQTYGELKALMEYGVMLQSSVGSVLKDKEQRELWQALSRKGFANHYPEQVDALELYLKGDRDGLARYHAANGTLAALGRDYKEFDE